MTEEIKCPCCCNVLTPDSEQAICVELFGECIFCRFSPNSKGSKSGTQTELSEIVIKQQANRRFRNQQPKTINMENFAVKPVVLMSDEHRAMIQRGVDRTTPPFKPDYNTEAVLVEEMQRMAKRIEDLEAKQEPVAWVSENAGLYHGKPDESLNPLPLYLSPSEGDIRALKHRIHALEGELLGYKKIVVEQDALLERQAARIVDLQTHIENLKGQE